MALADNPCRMLALSWRDAEDQFLFISERLAAQSAALIEQEATSLERGKHKNHQPVQTKALCPLIKQTAQALEKNITSTNALDVCYASIGVKLDDEKLQEIARNAKVNRHWQYKQLVNYEAKYCSAP